MRLEVLMGGAYGEGTGHVNSIAVKDAGTGLGYSAGACLWFDEIFGTDYLSYGLQLEYAKFTTNVGFVKGELHSTALSSKLALRKTYDETVSPYLGVGLAVGQMSGTVSSTARSFQRSGTFNRMAPIFQVFTGLDFALTESLYTGFECKYGYFDARFADVDAIYSKASFMLKLGVEF